MAALQPPPPPQRQQRRHQLRKPDPVSAARAHAEEGNPAQTLYFETQSGELAVSRAAQAGRLVMDLPLEEAAAAAVPPGAGLGSEFLRALLGAGGLEADEVLYSGRLRYLLVVLRGDGDATRRGLAELRPDLRRLEALHTEGRITGVIVAAQGECCLVLPRCVFWGAVVPGAPPSGSAASLRGATQAGFGACQATAHLMRWSPASSRPGRALMRTRSPAARTACWGPTGGSAWGWWR